MLTKRTRSFMIQGIGCGMHMTLEMSQMTIFDLLEESEDTYRLSLPDFLVRASVLLETVKDSQTRHEALYFSKSQGSHLFSDPNIYCLKTLMVLETTMEDEPLESSLAHWQRWGTWGENGKCLTARPTFPKIENGFSLSDILEDQVPEKYFLSDEKTATLLKSLESSTSKEMTTSKECMELGGVAPALPTMQGGGQEPKVLITKQNDTIKIRDIATCLDANYYKGLDCHQARTGVLEPVAVLTPDREEKRQNGRRFKEPGEPMFTLTAQDKRGVAIIDSKQVGDPRVYYDTCPTLQANDYKEPKKVTDGYRIRKLTPLECFRLQSFPDWWYVKLKLFRKPELIELVDMSRNDITAQVLAIIQENGIKEGMSDSQLYKMAGNGVTSAVSYEIGIRLQLSM